MSHSLLITPAELARHLDDAGWVVFDCRHQLTDPAYGHKAYAEGHIPGARFADTDAHLSAPPGPERGRHPLPEPDAFARWLGEQGVGNDTQVVAYDDGPGSPSARLWWMLRWLGHERVAVLDGGFARWQAEGHPVDTAVPQPRAATFVPHPRNELLVEIDEVAQRQGRAGAGLIDARGEARYRGDTEPMDPRAGHIPGAANHFYMHNVNEDGTWKAPEALRERLQALLGSTPPEDAIHYCGSGVSACHNLLAQALAGLGEGRLYVGSWSQWSSDPERPAATGEAP